MSVAHVAESRAEVEMAQLALNAGYPAEALKVIDRGLSLSLLGNGKDAANHTALRERGMNTFGASAPLKALQRRFGFEPS